MNYPLFHFDYQKIKHHLETIPPLIEKLNYLYFIKKELGNLIFLLNTSDLKEYNFNLQEDGWALFQYARDFDKFIKDLKELTKIKEIPELSNKVSELRKMLEGYKKGVSVTERDYKIEEKDRRKISFNYDIILEPIKNSLRKLQLCERSILNEIEYLNLQKELKGEDTKQGAGKTTNILPEKILWRDSQQDLVALYDELIKLGMIVPVKNKDQLLKKHFQILDENTEEAKELGELKHSRKQLNVGYAKPTAKMEAILKKLNDDKVDNK